MSSNNRTTENYSLLIVDDELITREGLKLMLNWENFSISSIFTASDGLEALKIVYSSCPDILITDIRMPEMDGLELIREVHQYDPSCVCIILSGYSEFDYAQKGVELGAIAYILKPLEPEELKQTILRATLMLNEMKIEKQLKYNSLRVSQKADSLMISNYWLQCINRSYKSGLISFPEDELSYLKKLKYSCYRVCSVGIISKNILSEELKNESYSIFVDTLKKQRIDPHINNIYSVMQKDRLVLIICLNELNTTVPFLIDTIDEIIKMISSAKSISFVASLGEPVLNHSDLFLSYDQAEMTTAYHLFFLHEGVFVADTHTQFVQENSFLISENEKTIMLDYIKSNRLSSLFTQLVILQNRCEAYRFQNKSIILSMLLEIIIFVSRSVETDLQSLDQYTNINTFSIQFLESFENIDQVFLWIKHYFTLLSNIYVDQDNTELENSLTAEMQEYINNNLSSNISIRDLAVFFHYSPNYIGRLFKKQFGINFSSYSNHQRIKHSCRLLEETSLTVSEISIKVGFCDCQYFIKVFKRFIGKTPNRYRLDKQTAHNCTSLT